MKNQSGTIKTNLELYRVFMGGSGGNRRLTGGSDHFSWQTNRQTLRHNIYIITCSIRCLAKGMRPSSSSSAEGNPSYWTNHHHDHIQDQPRRDQWSLHRLHHHYHNDNNDILIEPSSPSCPGSASPRSRTTTGWRCTGWTRFSRRRRTANSSRWDRYLWFKQNSLTVKKTETPT